ncbi:MULTISPECIES: adenosyl-hopene transferase HpnH [Methylocaldum]|jgi:hopanoid biosynthesis associated radical SAM protein HpnH|uniref:adenosyl-hopene transferase HpnH n=1 Tax=unclassified Methylocaldum TaxID=2622260 RepID=UPI00098B089E|nr:MULTISPECIES: adenosyl-hopene transferase HpnH [unclassified Methylocaldum]MVF20876.1 adenosyl-hopene transferase HpnH [Methylocaldum sp. BRCS4]
MSVPIRQQLSVAKYLLQQKLNGNKRYPLVLMLEPLFRCNLACAGCGKIDYPDDILNRRLSIDECLAAVDECGAPIVSIAGGEPLLHKELPQIIEGIIQRKKYVYLCTNALLLKKRIDDYKPSPYLTFSIHLDGNRERHDASVCQNGVFDRATEAVEMAIARGFRVTINCTLFQGENAEEIAGFLDYCKKLGVEGTTIAPGFSYEHAPLQDIFIKMRDSKELFRKVFKLGRGRKWKLNHSSLYLDFLAGNQAYNCTPWGNPTRNVFGWQKPCYLLVDEGYAPSFKALMEETPWHKYGNSKNPKCANCMAHCGYEASAVEDAVRNPLKAAWVALFGPRSDGPMAPEPVPEYDVETVGAKARPAIRIQAID